MNRGISCSETDNGDDTGFHKRLEIEPEDETTQPELPRFQFPRDESPDDDGDETPDGNGAG